MINNDLINPIRTRGAIRFREGTQGEELRKQPVRTRGAIRTRGAATAVAPQVRKLSSLELDKLLQKLRDELGQLPLTLIIHGWGTQPSAEFMDIIVPELQKNDAVWFIPAKGTESPTAPLEIDGAVVLNLNRDIDQRTYRNLIADILFFPATSKAEAEMVTEWKQRTRAVIVDGRVLNSDILIQAGCEVGIFTYSWSGDKALDEIDLSRSD